MIRKFAFALLLFFCLSIFLTAVPTPVRAQCDPTLPDVNLGDCFLLRDGKSVKDAYPNPAKLLNLVVANLFIAAGIIIFFLLFYAGLLFITEGVKGKEKALEVFKTAIIGFLMMFSAYWIVQIVRVVTGTDILF